MRSSTSPLVSSSRSQYGGVCAKASNDTLKFPKIASCHTIFAGSFAGANCSVLLGEIFTGNLTDLTLIVFRISQLCSLDCQPLVSLQGDLLVCRKEGGRGGGGSQDRRESYGGGGGEGVTEPRLTESQLTQQTLTCVHSSLLPQHENLIYFYIYRNMSANKTLNL